MIKWRDVIFHFACDWISLPVTVEFTDCRSFHNQISRKLNDITFSDKHHADPVWDWERESKTFLLIFTTIHDLYVSSLKPEVTFLWYYETQLKNTYIVKAYFYSSIRMTLYFLSVCEDSFQNIIMESKFTGIIWHRFSIQLTVFHATLATFSTWQIWRESYSLTHFLMGSGGGGNAVPYFASAGTCRRISGLGKQFHYLLPLTRSISALHNRVSFWNWFDIIIR